MSYTKSKVLFHLKVPQLTMFSFRNRFEKILQIYLGYCYFTFFTPFYFTFNTPLSNSTINNLNMRSWVPQKIICAFGSILVLFWTSLSVRQSFPSAGTALNPNTYFDIAILASNFMVKLTWTKLIWKNQKDIKRLFVHLQNLNFHAKNVSGKKHVIVQVCTNKLVICGIFLFYSLTMICNLFTCYSLCRGHTTRDIFYENGYLQILCDWMRWALNVQGTCNVSNLTTLDIVLIGIGTIGYILRNLSAFLPDIYTCLSAIILWCVVYTFCVNLPQISAINSSEEWKAIYQDFHKVVKTAKLVNKAIGLLPFWHLIENTVYYSLRFQQAFLDVLRKNEWTNLIRMITFVPAEIGMFIIAADVCRQVRKIKH